MTATTCKTCNRVILVEHADEDGNCVLCAPKEEPEPPPRRQRKSRAEEPERE